MSYVRNLPAFAVLTVLAFLPVFAVEFLAGDGAQVTFKSEGPMPDMSSVLVAGLALVLAVFGWCWFSAGIARGAVADLGGRRAGLRAVLLGPFGTLPSVAAVVLLGGFGFVTLMLAGILANEVVPVVGILAALLVSLLAYLVFWVVVPAITVERLGPLRGLMRSVRLTRGRRLSLFALALMWLVLALVVSFLVGLATGGTTFEGSEVSTDLAIGQDQDWLSNIAGLVLFGIGNAIAAAAYHDLRILHDGIDPARIAEAFD